jgi:hypothetical protein
MGQVYIDGWGRLTVEVGEGEGIIEAYIDADMWLMRNGYPEAVGTVALLPCGINKYRMGD